MLNQEEMLELSLSTLEEYPKHQAAWGILRWYATSDDSDQTDEVLDKRVNEIRVAWKLKRMVEAGLMEYDFDKKTYRLTAEGIEIGEALRRLDANDGR
jgi:hypothetical protein